MQKINGLGWKILHLEKNTNLRNICFFMQEEGFKDTKWKAHNFYDFIPCMWNKMLWKSEMMHGT